MVAELYASGDLSLILRVSINRSKMSFSSGRLSSWFMLNHDNASAAWCLISV